MTDPRAELVGVVDSDYQIEPAFLSRCAPLFADPDVGFIQAPQDYRDWSTAPYYRRLYYSYRYFFAISQPSRNERNGAIFAGTMGLIRRKALEDTGGWDEWCITEDAELSLRLLHAGWSGLHVDQSLGRGVMPLTFEALKSQRYRWCFGGIQILRTRKTSQTGAWWEALRANFAETLLAMLGAAGIAGSLTRTDTSAGPLLAGLLLFPTLGLAAAPLNSLAARRAALPAYLRERRRTEWQRDRAAVVRGTAVGGAAAAVVASVAAVLALFLAPSHAPVQSPQLVRPQHTAGTHTRHTSHPSPGPTTPTPTPTLTSPSPTPTSPTPSLPSPSPTVTLPTSTSATPGTPAPATPAASASPSQP